MKGTNSNNNKAADGAQFEIRVAVIGYVSVGKTTVTNALFGAEYGEVSMCRTTAVVNNFRTSCTSKEKSQKTTVEDTTTDEDDASVQVVVQEKPQRATPNATLKQSIADNAANRNAEVVVEKIFDIELDEPLHDMRKDTKLVIVDIPGINEAGASSKYKDYVTAKWHTFDIAVVVMDGRQGVNTEEQLDLLKLVKKNSESTRKIPTIVLLNKVDDPYNEEQRRILKDAREAVESLFAVDDREKSLQQLLEKSGDIGDALYPAVVPVSAVHAFLYRCGSKLSFDDFCKMDNDFIESIGKESYGRQWKRFQGKTRLEKAFEAVSEEEQCKDGLEASNIEAFVKVLALCIGDEDQQEAIVGKQVEVALSRMASAQDDCSLGAELVEAHTKLSLLGLPTGHLKDAFWQAYQTMADEALSTFDLAFSPSVFARPLDQLVSYKDAVDQLDVDKSQIDEICRACKDLVLQYALKVLENEKKICKSPRDLSLVLGAMLLPSHHAMFSMHLGTLKLELDLRYANAKTSVLPNESVCCKCNGPTTAENGGTWNVCQTCKIKWLKNGPDRVCPQCEGYTLTSKRKGDGFEVLYCGASCGLEFFKMQPITSSKLKVDNGRLVPVDGGESNVTASVVIPDSLDDPNHFGYPFWRCCSLLQAAAESN